MNRRTKTNRDNMIRKLSLPEDLFLGVPLFTMNREGQMLIENHRGILLYTTEQVEIRTKKGIIRIGGRELVIESYTQDTLTVCGRIEQIRLLWA